MIDPIWKVAFVLCVVPAVLGDGFFIDLAPRQSQVQAHAAGQKIKISTQHKIRATDFKDAISPHLQKRGICSESLPQPKDVDGLTFSEKFYGYAVTSTQGQNILAIFSIQINNGARVSLSVCPKPRHQVTQACFDQNPGLLIYNLLIMVG